MATRSTIALEFTDGTVQQVYCHWDGYLSNNGRILLEHWSDPFKLQQLIDLGSISSLGAEIGVKHPFDNPHPYASEQYKAHEAQHRHMTKFYARDRGEELVVEKFKNFEDYVRNHQFEEYEYILRNVGGLAVWFVACRDTRGFEPLLDVMVREAESEDA